MNKNAATSQMDNNWISNRELPLDCKTELNASIIYCLVSFSFDIFKHSSVHSFPGTSIPSLKCSFQLSLRSQINAWFSNGVLNTNQLSSVQIFLLLKLTIAKIKQIYFTNLWIHDEADRRTSMFAIALKIPIFIKCPIFGIVRFLVLSCTLSTEINSIVSFRPAHTHRLCSLIWLELRLVCRHY